MRTDTLGVSKHMVGTSALPEGVDARRSMFLRLAREHESVLLRVAKRLSNGDSDAAADCVQEAIIVGYRAFMVGRLHDPSGFRPWILRILTHRFHIEWRRLKRTTAFADMTGLVELNQTDGPPEAYTRMEQEVVREQVAAALACLPLDMRACITLVDLEGMEYAEAADVLEVPVGTVRSRLSRGRMRLAEILTAKEVEP